MSTSLIPPTGFAISGWPSHWTLEDIQAHVGGVPLNRIRATPLPGTATENDLFEIQQRHGVCCELVDGVVVEKAMGTYESALAMALVQLLTPYLAANPLGVLTGEQGPLRFQPHKVRMPDVGFIRWERFKNRRVPRERVWQVAPDLAVEILSDGNTAAEMDLKLAEYIAGGTRLVWIIDPEQLSAKVYTSARQFTTLDQHGTLDGGDVLPGLRIKLADLFNAVRREE